VITTKSSLSTRLENVLTRVLAKLDGSSESLNAFSSTLANIAAISHTLAARSPVIERAIADAGSTLRNTAASSIQISPALQAVELSAAAFERMGSSVNQTRVQACQSPLLAQVSRE
jgi:phospholipid/cholesterol/gamma-HCH transport system substrate-binding protein